MKYKSLGFNTPDPATPKAEPVKTEVPHFVQEENKLRKILEAEIKGTTWEVVCVVSRHKGEDEKKARAAYAEYVAKSDMGYGSVGHEPVMLLFDGQVVQEHRWSGIKGGVK